jgi:hypothetical protein
VGAVMHVKNEDLLWQSEAWRMHRVGPPFSDGARELSRVSLGYLACTWRELSKTFFPCFRGMFSFSATVMKSKLWCITAKEDAQKERLDIPNILFAFLRPPTCRLNL